MKKHHLAISPLICILLLTGCATTIPQSDHTMLTQRVSSLLGDYDGETIFLSYPSVGKSRDAVFMNQRKTIGRPTQSGTDLANSLASNRDRKVCYTMTGASSARTAYIVTEAFSLIKPEVQLPKLTLIFIGESQFEAELRQVVESRGARFLFSEYTPPIKS